MTTAATSRLASVVYLRGQDDSPQLLSAAIERALSGWPPASRLLLEAPGTAAIVGLDGAPAALDAARRAARKPGLVVALHHGPVQLSGPDGRQEASGEGLDGAIAAAAQARPGDTGAMRTTPAFDQALASTRRARVHLVGVAGVAGLLALGGIGRIARQRWNRAQLATLLLEIRPAGEIWIDGDHKGSVPPLARLRIAAGSHTLEVRHARFKPLRMELQLDPGEEMTIRHEFRAAPPPAAGRGNVPQWMERMQDRVKDWLPR